MTMSAISPVGQLVAERPGRARVLEALGIDYCCGGRLPLEDACRARGIDVGTALSLLEAEDTRTVDDANRDACAGMTLSELADHIEIKHHAHLREVLPRLQHLARKVADAHGERDTRLHRVRSTLADFAREMSSHMLKEEHVLFPMIRAMERTGIAAESHCGSIANPIRQMEAEHSQGGDALAEMRALTDGFVPPSDACNSYRALLDGLADLERDTHLHVHKENNILFPGAIRCEATGRTTRV
jgi:regulator of cell morphogenesis and NO signaling